jgi:2-polyprenyl-3-methyl-5-hydroxy-6-metoxy-1,4-benzoquinol methylase
LDSARDIQVRRETEIVSRCLICNDKRQKLLFWGEDNRFGYPGSYPLVECQQCGLIYLAARPLPSELSKIYQKFYAPQKKILHRKSLKTQIKESIKNSSFGNLVSFLNNPREYPYGLMSIRSGVRVLDVGSGLVSHAALRIVKSGGSWTGIEIDAALAKVIEQTGLDCFCGTIEEFSQNKPFPFNYIILSQVLEHLYNPRASLEIARSLLSSDGEIILSCPNSDSHLRKRYGKLWLHWHVPYHVAHYNKETLFKLAFSAGLRISNVTTTTPSNWYYAQHKLGLNMSFDECWLSKKIIPQRLLDLYLWKVYRADQGDNLTVILKNISGKN